MASPYADLVHEAWGGWWIVAAVRGGLYVAPTRPIHRPHHGDYTIGPDLRAVATWAYGFDTREAALTVARDLFPYEALRARREAA